MTSERVLSIVSMLLIINNKCLINIEKGFRLVITAESRLCWELWSCGQTFIIDMSGQRHDTNWSEAKLYHLFIIGHQGRPLLLLVTTNKTTSLLTYLRSSSICFLISLCSFFFSSASRLFMLWIILRMRAYSASTPNTWIIQDTTQVSTAVRPFTTALIISVSKRENTQYEQKDWTLCLRW